MSDEVIKRLTNEAIDKMVRLPMSVKPGSITYYTGGARARAGFYPLYAEETEEAADVPLSKRGFGV